MWSNIILRRIWRAKCDPRCIDLARCSVNCEVGRAIRTSLGSVVRHLDIRVWQSKLYRDDGGHLSDIGLDLFLQDLQGVLRAEIFGNDGLGAYKKPHGVVGSVRARVWVSSRRTFDVSKTSHPPVWRSQYGL